MASARDVAHQYIPSDKSKGRRRALTLNIRLPHGLDAPPLQQRPVEAMEEEVTADLVGAIRAKSVGGVLLKEAGADVARRADDEGREGELLVNDAVVHLGRSGEYVRGEE